MGAHLQKSLAGGSLGFEVPAAVEELKLTPGGLGSGVLHLASRVAGSKVKPPIL